MAKLFDQFEGNSLKSAKARRFDAALAGFSDWATVPPRPRHHTPPPLDAAQVHSIPPAQPGDQLAA
jgi:hypothetical protein